MFISQRIASSGTRNPPEELDSSGESPAQRHVILPRKGIQPGISSSFALIQSGKIKKRGNPPNGGNFRISSSKFSLPTFIKFKYENPIKMKNKPDPALSDTSLSFQLNQKKDKKIS
jgi:hypothetical protein